MLDKILESCQYLLHNFPEARECKDYLDSRLLSESQKLFGFGYFPGMKNLRALTDMVGEETLVKENLLYYTNIEDSMCPRSIPNCYFEQYPLVFPFRDPYGKVVALVGRCLLSDLEREQLPEKISKYKNTKGFKKGNFVYGLYENKRSILQENCVYVVEGQFDVIKAVERGIKNIVGLGTNGMTPYQFSVISRYTNNIILLLDNDDGGEKGRKSITDKFGKYANIQNFYLPNPYKDIDEYLTKSGDESVSFVVRG